MPEHLSPRNRDGEDDAATRARNRQMPVMNKTENCGPSGRTNKANHVAAASPESSPLAGIHGSMSTTSITADDAARKDGVVAHCGSNRYSISCAARALMLLGVFLCLFEAYGTAVIVFACGVSQVVVHCVVTCRPPTYMKSNEAFSYVNMLVASHDNAMDWSLVGDRGIIDTLFNKPMSVVPESKAVHWAVSWFRLSHILQLAAMAFVAAEKGWDGVFLCGWSAPDCGGVDGEVKIFEFGGAFAMLGAIQGVYWVQCPRRDAFLATQLLAFSTLVTRGGLIIMCGSIGTYRGAEESDLLCSRRIEATTFWGFGVWGFGILTHSDATGQWLLPFAEKPSKAVRFERTSAAARRQVEYPVGQPGR